METLRIIVSVLLACAGFAFSQEHPENKAIDSVQQKISEALVRSRAAIDKFGVTDSAMIAIEDVLSELAAIPSIKTCGTMKQLHGSPSMGRALLASESDSGISLYVTRFDKDAATPVHDHLTWGVIRVLEGRDRYTHWTRVYNLKSADSSVARAEQRVLKKGDSTFWLGPPNDVHSQQAVDGELWELVMTGRDLSSDYVTKNHHYYDSKTGRLSSTKPK